MLEGKGKDTQDNRAVPPCYKVRRQPHYTPSVGI
jgi:hypothetical protein